jgi:hypothetical protein
MISGSSRAAEQQLTSEVVELLRELVEGVRDLTKVTWGLAGIGYQIFQQNVKLFRLGERQAYLEEQARKRVRFRGRVRRQRRRNRRMRERRRIRERGN